MTLSLQAINIQLTVPLFVTAPPGDNTRYFVVEKGGTIKVVNRADDTLIGTFLDISSLVDPNPFGEGGLHGLAFDPQYSSNGRFYVSYSTADNMMVVARYVASPPSANQAQATADLVLMTEQNLFGNLFGGGIVFDSEGFLYIGRGDGGVDQGTADPNNNAQNAGQVLGKILRINVNGDDFPQDSTRNYAVPPDNPCVGQAGARPEIWSFGTRNPWRFSFDRQTGDLYMADVGHDGPEEVNVATAANARGRGINYGWKTMEGKECFTAGCDISGLQQPVLDYQHAPNSCNSVIGGYVYRGTNPALAALQGTYFYGDMCQTGGFVRSFRFVNNAVTEHFNWPDLNPQGGQITSFGEDAQGDLYITTALGGLFRIIP